MFKNLSLFKKIAILMSFILIVLFAVPKNATYGAAGSWVGDQKECLGNTFTSDGICLTSWLTNVTISTACALVTTLNGCMPGICVPSEDATKDYCTQLTQGSVQSSLARGILNIYETKPADIAYYIHDTGQTLGFIPKSANAQGVGFAGLAPLLPIWKVFRNLAYVVLAFIMVVVGFMIMLRKKIDPKTVVTVQNSLPRIVIALLLVTFSYAIVGILIDIMYLVIALVINIFMTTGLLPDYATKEPSTFISGSLLQNINMIPESELPWRIVFGINPLMQVFGKPINVTGWLYAATAAIGAIAGKLVEFVAGSKAGMVVGGIVGLSLPVLALIITIAMIFLMIRLFIFFLGAYIKIIIALVFAPFQLMTEAVPGVNAFSSWFRNLVSNIIVFPVAAVMFMLAQVFMKFSLDDAVLWSPPYVSLFKNNGIAIGALVAVGILFSIPTVVNQVQELFKAKPMISAGPENIAGVMGQPLQFGWQVFQFLFQKGQFDKLNKAMGGSGGGGGHGGGH